MKVSVVGTGYVGLVAAACLAEAGNNVICVDKDCERISELERGIIPIYETGLGELVKRNSKAERLHFTTDLKEAVEDSLVIFIAVGTPSTDDGSADISAVLEVCGSIAECMDGYRIIATKSTVPVGTCKKVSEIISAKTEHPFDYVSNPEFLKEGAAVEDFMKPERIIVGSTNPAVLEIMKQLYGPFMRKKGRIISMEPASAELTKYAANCMLATRISFMNELSVLCEKLGADIELIREGIGSDSRIGNAFLFAGVGYGGSCFPKDVSALIHTGDENCCPQTILKSVREANWRQQHRFAQGIIKYFKSKPEQVVLAVWGLAFKARTDDIRQSPTVTCIEEFVKAGIAVRAYDPRAKLAEDGLAKKIEVAANGYEILEGSDALVIFTDWQEFRNPDFESIANKLNKPLIFDGRNLYDPKYLQKLGFEYHCIGRAERK